MDYPVSVGNDRTVHQDYKTTAVEIWAYFLIVVRSKVTGLVVQYDPRNIVLKAESRMQGSLDIPRLRSLRYKRDIGLEMPHISGGCLDTLLQSKQEMAMQRVPPESVSKPTSTSASPTAADTACISAGKESTTTIPAYRFGDSQPIIGVYLKKVTIIDGDTVRPHRKRYSSSPMDF